MLSYLWMMPTPHRRFLGPASLWGCSALALALQAGPSPAAEPRPVVIDRPISFSAKRQEATRRYVFQHAGVRLRGVELDPRMVVIHWTGTASLQAAWDTFDAETLPPSRSDIASGGDLNVSAHFLVDRDGTIYRLMPENWVARHVIGLNLAAVGIENVGGALDEDDLTEAQLRADEALVRSLKARRPRIAFLIGHHESLRFQGQELWKEKDPLYRTRKLDPGPRFMARLRASVRDLGLQGAP